MQTASLVETYEYFLVEQAALEGKGLTLVVSVAATSSAVGCSHSDLRSAYSTSPSSSPSM